MVMLPKHLSLMMSSPYSYAHSRLLYPIQLLVRYRNEFGIGTVPCNIVWSNAHRFNPAVAGGRCISFAAISAGDIFVIFSAIPNNKDTWYYVQISPNGVAMYKGHRIMKFVDDISARALGSSRLFQLYFVCVKEDHTTSTTTILYGKTMDNRERGHVYAAFHDTGENIHPRFYAFGVGDHEVEIMDAHVLPTSATGEHVCVGHTIQFEGSCVEDCHMLCIGCYQPDDPKSCRKCRYAKLDDTCVAACPADTHQIYLDGVTCMCKNIEDMKCVSKCSDDRLIMAQILPEGGKSITINHCVCKFENPDDMNTCLAGCPLNTSSHYDAATGITLCGFCHPACHPQDGVPVCSGKNAENCENCDTSPCRPCGEKYYIDFQRNPPTCTTCTRGYHCPGNGYRYICNVDADEYSPPSSSTCLKCPKNQYSFRPPSSSCHSCPRGFYKKNLTEKCIRCPGYTGGPNCKLPCAFLSLFYLCR